MADGYHYHHHISPDIETTAAITHMQSIEGVDGEHHAHFWQMNDHRNAVDAHMVVSEGAWHNADTIKDQVKHLLSEGFGIDHSTLEMECAFHTCDDAQVIGHAGA